MGSRHLFTSESVTEGHPDKIADQISDAVVDAMIAQDPMSRVACETLVTTGMAFVAGEVTSRAYVEIPELVRQVIGEIGYDSAEFGFDSNTCAVMTTLDAQSPDIAMGVDRGGAGDQGLMFGYACRETKELMPLPITLAHKMTQRLSRMRRNGRMKYLRPDGKSQVTVEYDDTGHPVRVDTVVISSQHAANVTQKRIHRDVIKNVIMPVIPKRMIDKARPIKFHINPTGQFIKGGPMADSGLTGRKIIVDTYGGVGSHGGGAFSGKDPSKVDRSASYGARWVAKNLVASGLCERAEVQIAYAIGKVQPVSIMVDSKGTGEVDDDKLTRAVRRVFDLTPKGLIKELKLRRPIFRKTAAYGHFGRNEPEFLWEKTNKARALRRAV